MKEKKNEKGIKTVSRQKMQVSSLGTREIRKGPTRIYELPTPKKLDPPRPIRKPDKK